MFFASFVVYGTHMFFVSMIKLRSKNRQGEFGDDIVTGRIIREFLECDIITINGSEWWSWSGFALVHVSKRRMCLYTSSYDHLVCMMYTAVFILYPRGIIFWLIPSVTALIGYDELSSNFFVWSTTDWSNNILLLLIVDSQLESFFSSCVRLFPTIFFDVLLPFCGDISW